MFENNKNISFPIGPLKIVNDYWKKFGLDEVFKKYKTKGHDINNLMKVLVSYKLGENLSISKCSDWANQPEILEKFELSPFHEKTLFRTLGTIGINLFEIVNNISKNVIQKHNIYDSSVVMDWSSLVVHGEKANLANYGFSKDHRFDKKQLTFGVAELGKPYFIPLALTVMPGNTSDMTHFKETYNEASKHTKPGTLFVFDKGANSINNLSLVDESNMKYLTSKKLNASDKVRILSFDKSKADYQNEDTGIYGIKYETQNGKTTYLFYSRELEKKKLETREKQAMKKFEEAKTIQAYLDKNKKLPVKYQLKNELVDINIDYQTKLKDLSDEDAKKYIRQQTITRTEGFFALISSQNLTLEEALKLYFEKDSIEKFINSLKNEIIIKPVRVWTDEAISGAFLVGYLAHLFVSLIRYENENLRKTSPKFIKHALKNLTLTIEYGKNLVKREIWSNFNSICKTIFTEKLGIP